MSELRVKFRCVHCNRLLSAPLKRVGKAIACPKCVQAVKVPAPGEGGELASAESPPAGRPAPLREGFIGPAAEVATEIPDEILAIQPEDIRAEGPRLPIRLAPEDRPDFLAEGPSGEAIAPAEPPPEAAVDVVGSVQAARRNPWFAPTDDLPEEFDDLDGQSSIEIEPPTMVSTSAAPAWPARRGAEITLPASVVLAWSMFVLFALAFAFIAGLMVGHFYWKHA